VARVVLQLNERGLRQSYLEDGSDGDLLASLVQYSLDLYIILYERHSDTLPLSIISLTTVIVLLHSQENIETLHAKKKRNAINEKLSTGWIVDFFEENENNTTIDRTIYTLPTQI